MASVESLLLVSRINALFPKTCGNYPVIGHDEIFFFFAMTVKAKERKIEVHRQKAGLPIRTPEGERLATHFPQRRFDWVILQIFD
jgi:hypothetical protein